MTVHSQTNHHEFSVSITLPAHNVYIWTGGNNFQGGSSYIPPPSGNFNQQRPQQNGFGNRPSASSLSGQQSRPQGGPQGSPSTSFTPPSTSYGIPAGNLSRECVLISILNRIYYFFCSFVAIQSIWSTQWPTTGRIP